MSNANDFVIKEGILEKYIGPGGNVEIPAGVTIIDFRAFAENKTITSVTIPDTVKHISTRAFEWCFSLEKVQFSEGLLSLGQSCFHCCRALSEISFPKSLTVIYESAFFGCDSLESVSIPQTITALGKESTIYHNKGAFQLCKNLKSVSLECSGDVIEKECFDGCKELREVYVPAEYAAYNTRWWKERFFEKTLCIIALSNFDAKALLTKYVMRDSIETVKTLISLERPDLIQKLLGYSKIIELDTLNKMLEIAREANCPEATTLLMEYQREKYPTSKINALEVADKEKALGARKRTIADWKKLFEYTKKEEGILIDRYIGTEKAVEVPAAIGKTPVYKVGLLAFSRCSDIRSVYISDGITELSAIFSGEHLQSIRIPDTIRKFGGILKDCPSLQYAEKDGCLYLGNEKNPYVMLVQVKNKEMVAFEFCEATKIVCPKAFENCTELTNIKIPSSVTCFGYAAFLNCEKLQDVYYDGSISEWHKISFINSDSNHFFDKANLHIGNP